MTQKEKKVLLVDLCARLPYGVKIDKVLYGATTLHERDIESFRNGFVDTLIPYLRPMSSMTKEEKKEYAKLLFADLGGVYEDYYKALDYLNSLHFDYRGLIEKGLALEALEGMYGKEE